MTSSKTQILLWAHPQARRRVETALAAMESVALTSVASGEEAVAALPGTEILAMPVFHVDDTLAAAIRGTPSLKWIQLLTVGFDRLTPQNKPKGVLISTAGGSLAPAIADHVLTMLLGLFRKLPEVIASQQKQAWDRSLYERFKALDRCRVTVFGFGAIGQAVAKRLKGFDCEVTGVNTSGSPHPLADRMYATKDLKTALGGADAVVVCAALNAGTRHLFDGEIFACMAEGTVLVNVARGPIVVTDALTEALASGRLAGAGLDVMDPEPLPPGHALWSCPNVIVTPHIAAGGAGPTLARFVVENVSRYVAGKPPFCLIEI